MELNGRTFFLEICMRVRSRNSGLPRDEVEAMAYDCLAALSRKVQDVPAERYFESRRREVLGI